MGVVSTLLLLGTVGLAVGGKPADVLGWATLLTADVAIVLSGLLILRAYRSAKPVREIIGLLLFSLAVAHIAGFLVCTHFHCLLPLRELLIQTRIIGS